MADFRISKMLSNSKIRKDQVSIENEYALISDRTQYEKCRGIELLRNHSCQ